MIAPGKAFPLVKSPWSWPIDLTSYDCSPGLTEVERQEIALVAVRSGGPGNSGMRPKRSYQVLHRLLTPLVDICQIIQENYTDWTNQNSTCKHHPCLCVGNEPEADLLLGLG